MISGYGRDLAEAMNSIAGKAEATLFKKLYYTISGKPEPVEAGEPIVIDVEPEAPLITVKATEQATDEQAEMFRKCVEGIENAANVTMLSMAWEAVNSLKKSKALTDDQIKQLTALKDIRKQALK